MLGAGTVPFLYSGEFNCLELDPDVSPDTSYCLEVTRVIKNSAAERAGILPGDRVICIDGLRVFSMEEYVIVRFMNDTKSNIPLTIIRNGAVQDIRLNNPKPVRRAGYYMQERKEIFLKALIRHKVFPFSNAQSGKPEPLAEQLDNGFRTWMAGSAFFTNQSVYAQENPMSAESMLTWFPMRAQAAIVNVLKTADGHTRLWIKRLLEVYLLLRRAQYDSAAGWITDGNMTDNPPDPFLNVLLAFYQQVLRHRSPADKDDLFALLECTPDTFLLCYPFPVEMTGKNRKSFAFDPEFQKAYSASINTAPRLPKEVNDLAIEYIRRSMKSKNETERYMLQARAALINPKSYGRWLHRSYLIRNKSTRLTVFKGLKKRWTEQPEERGLTAFGLACVALLEKDMQTFENAYRTIQASGARETARLYGSLYEMCRRSRRSGISWQAVREKITAISGDATLPAVYARLMEILPDSDFAFPCGVFDKEQRKIISFAEYVEKNKSTLARCLRHRPLVDPDARVADAVKNGTVKTRKDLATLLSREIAYYPSQHTFDLFLQLAGSTPRDHIFDCICFFIGYHFSTQQKNPINVSQIPHYFQPMEYLHYEEIYKTLQKMKPSDPKFDSVVAQSLAQAGVPSVYLLIASTLRDADKTRRAQQMTEKIVNFYESLAGVYHGNNFLWNALRDFASVPGFSEQARPYNKDFVQKRLYYDSTYVLSAILSSYTNDTRQIVSQLKKSVSPRIQKDSGQFIYGGKVYTEVADLRKDFVRDLEKRKILSQSEWTELKKTSGLASVFNNTKNDTVNTVRLPPKHAPSPKHLKKSRLPAKSEIVLRVDDRFAPLEWIGTRKGEIVSHNPKTGDVVYYKQGLPVVLFPDFNVRKLLPLKERVWVGSNHGLFALIRAKGKWKEIAVNATEVDMEITGLSVKDNLLTITYGKERKAVLDVEKNEWK